MNNIPTSTGRRVVRLQSLDDIIADAESLVAGPIQTLGNWSPGQIFEHLARSYQIPLRGEVLPIPFYIRWGARVMLPWFLRRGMPTGIKLTGKSRDALVSGPISTEEGLAHLREAVNHWKAKTSIPRHSVFGNVSDEQWTQIHLRHAELHLSFLTPASAGDSKQG